MVDITSQVRSGLAIVFQQLPDEVKTFTFVKAADTFDPVSMRMVEQSESVEEYRGLVYAYDQGQLSDSILPTDVQAVIELAAGATIPTADNLVRVEGKEYRIKHLNIPPGNAVAIAQLRPGNG